MHAVKLLVRIPVTGRSYALVNDAASHEEGVRRIRALDDQKVTVFDAITAVVCLRLESPVWTYDHHFDVMRVPVWHPA